MKNTTLVTENRYLVSTKTIVMNSMEAKKYEIIQKVIALTNDELLDRLNQTIDAGNDLTEAQKNHLKEAIEQCERSEVIPHEEVMASLHKKYSI